MDISDLKLANMNLKIGLYISTFIHFDSFETLIASFKDIHKV